MVDWIEPLNLKLILINVFSGDASYFTGIAIFVILSLAGALRMTNLTMGFMIMVFLLMFSGYVPMSLIVLIAIVSGLLVGIIIPKIVSR